MKSTDHCSSVNPNVIVSTVSDHFESHIKTIQKTYVSLQAKVAQVSMVISQSLGNGGTLFWCGNGGSAADSQHLAAELIGRFSKTRKSLRSIALTSDSSVMTCVANDFNYDLIYSRQLEGLARPGDVLVGISTSGNSPNIIHVLQQAKNLGVTTIGLLGNDGGAAVNFVEHALVVPCNSTARIQEAHILVGHIICDLVEKELCFGY